MDIHIDCSNGICGAMVVGAFGDMAKRVFRECSDAEVGYEGFAILVDEMARSVNMEGLGPHRKFREIENLIVDSSLSSRAKTLSVNIYREIAKAEAEVHESTLDDVHFHEVGRNEAIENIVRISAMVDCLKIEKIYTSPIFDGRGHVNCSHGKISVPVPAVKSMMKRCDYEFRSLPVDGELVTPSGLGILMGLGALKWGGGPPCRGKIWGEGHGSREAGRGGLVVIKLGEKGQRRFAPGEGV